MNLLLFLCLSAVFVAYTGVITVSGNATTVTEDDKAFLRDRVLEMFQHAYDAYMDNAYPADELMPIACTGRVRGLTPSRGDVDDSLGNFSLTLIDSLDTLAVLGLHDLFEDAVKKVEGNVSFKSDFMVSVFETNIRVLGGLLGGHSAAVELKQKGSHMQWYNGSLLNMAVDLGNRLLPAFNTTSGMPMARINLMTGAVRTEKDRSTCTACAGTIILEMAALSRFTGNPVYEEKARAAMDYLWSRRQRSTDLMGTVLSVENGEWTRKESGIGAGIDSYYEYLLKAYILLGDETFLQRFNTHYDAIKQYIAQGPLMLDVLMHKPTTVAKTFIDSLSAFWPGIQVLKGDVNSAIETHEFLYQVFNKHTFLPEAFTTKSFDVHWGQYPLRPEFAESTYLLYKATKDPYYLQVGKTIIDNLEKRTRVDCGYAGILDVRSFKKEDRMDSYFLAEMFKYLFLLFTPDDEELPIDIENYIFTTEAHILPLHLSLKSPNGEKNNNSIAAEEWKEGNFGRSCVNSVNPSSIDLDAVEDIRKKVDIVKQAAKQSSSTRTTLNTIRTTPRTVGSKIVHTTSTSTEQEKLTLKKISTAYVTELKGAFTGERRLYAKDFSPANDDHKALLTKMGISILVMNDGKLQLIQDQKRAATVKDSMEGALFMHEMIELSNSATQNVKTNPLFVQLLSHPYMGSVALKGGPGQFGPPLENSPAVYGEIVYADPYWACEDIDNGGDMQGKIVVAGRGNCMFVKKAKNVERHGAVGIIIIDNEAGSSFDENLPFSMAGDDVTETIIPAIFLFSKEGSILKDCYDEVVKHGNKVNVALADVVKPLTELVLEGRIHRQDMDDAIDQSDQGPGIPGEEIAAVKQESEDSSDIPTGDDSLSNDTDSNNDDDSNNNLDERTDKIDKDEL